MRLPTDLDKKALLGLYERMVLLRRFESAAQIACRKGETPAEAGPDFGDADVKRAQDFFRSVAPHLVTARPEKF